MSIRVRGSRFISVALDLACVALLVAAYAARGSTDVLFHAAWVVLTTQAFLYGIRRTLPRIVLAAAAITIYSVVTGPMPGHDPSLPEDLLLSEWPPMLAILLMVAITADRGFTTSRRYATLYRQASDRLLSAQEDERRRLALDLHDGVGQTLTAISLTLDAASASLQAGGRGAASVSASRIDHARLLADAALEETRRVAANLRPARLSERGLGAAVEELAATAGVGIETHIADAVRIPGLLPSEAEVGVFRIIQEAVANATRHAHAAHIVVHLRVQRDQFVAEIIDDGRGFRVSALSHRSVGIVGMRERATVIGGRLRIRSRVGVGTTVDLRVPLPAVHVPKPVKRAAATS